ncbi:hypothetical protein [Alicyclobacillus fodiniaquatilis]|uniref:Membrane protein YfhO n=1 Tax=Alicyclobacillus fodiniaquatilis TaxID=1661150 RepID=A0ABW4JHV6_9BACL
MSKYGNRILWCIGYIAWGVFVNALSVWVIGPLVQDLAIYGVVIVMAIICLWFTSIPQNARRRFVSFTVFSLLLGQGLSNLAFDSMLKSLGIGLILTVGLFIAALWFGRVRFIPLVLATIAVVLANTALPFNNWPFLTQFRIVQHGRLHIDPHDMEAAPFGVVNTPTGEALLTQTSYVPSKALLEQLVDQATNSPDALANVLATAQGEYGFVELKMVNGHVKRVTPSIQDLAKANPLQFIKSFFPFQLAHWYVANGQIAQYMSPYMTSNQAVETALYPTTYAQTMQALTNQAVKEEESNWNSVVSQLGGTPKPSGWQLDNGHLVGTYQGQKFSLAVKASSVVGEGDFTATGTHQVLLVGDNELDVVDLDQKKVVATYKGTQANPVPNDVVFGPLAHGGRDAVLVNASPAYILTVASNGRWQRVYQAPSASFRFETVLDTGKGAPQIVTDDPSMVRNAATRYFTAYHYVNGQLERDWRVFRTNVVNVTPITWQSGGPEDLAVSIYGSGQYLILQKSNFPVLPTAVIVFGLLIVAGWVIRIRQAKGGKRA